MCRDYIMLPGSDGWLHIVHYVEREGDNPRCVKLAGPNLLVEEKNA